MLEWDEEKRLKTMRERSLDFAYCVEVFARPHVTVCDERQDYGELRFISIGMVARRIVVIVWTKRGIKRRIISMRKANEREKTLYKPRLD
jgi:uncharacterized protein